MTFIKSDTHFKGITSSTFCVSKIVCFLIKWSFCYQKLSRILVVFHAYYACFSKIISCSTWAVHHFSLLMGLSLQIGSVFLQLLCYKVIYFISISRLREGYTPWNSVILSANKILLITSVPLWDSIKYIQHLYHHTVHMWWDSIKFIQHLYHHIMHMWQKSKGLSVRILRNMPLRNL